MNRATMPEESAPNSSAAVGAPAGASRFPRWRLLAAFALTAGLIYPIGRTVVVGLLAGIPETRFAMAAAAGVAVLAALTWNLASRIVSRRTTRTIDWLVTLLWILLGMSLLWFSASDWFGLCVAGPLFLLSTLPFVRLGWVAFDLANCRRRLVRVLALFPFVALFPLLIKVTGLTGGALVQFEWRFAPRVDPGSQLAVPDRDAGDPPFAIEIVARPKDDFPQFLGPARSGVLTEVVLRDDWNKTPPREVWRRDVGAGWSGFAVVGEYCFTQEQRGDKECVVCYALADGTEIWVHADVARFESDMGGIGPRATPTLHGGDAMFTVGGTGLLNCIRPDTGSRLWGVDLLKDNDGGPIAHGVCGSPLIVGDRVIVAPTGMKSGCLAAYDAIRGKRLWQGGKHPASYGSPALLELAGKTQIVMTTSEGIEAVESETGASLWSYPWTNEVHVNCSQPIVVDAAKGRVLMCNGYNGGSVLLEVQPSPSGEWKVAEVWTSGGVMKTKFTTALLHEGFVYGLDDGIFACMDVATGKQRWKGGRYRHGQVLLAGGLLIIQTEDPGDVVLVRPNSNRLEELARIPALSTMTWNNPTVAGKRLLVRNNREAVCFELP